MGLEVVYKGENKVSQINFGFVLKKSEVFFEPMKPAMICWRDASKVFVIPFLPYAPSCL